MTRATTRGGNTCGAGTTKGAFGTRLLLKELAKNNGAARGQDARLWRIGKISSLLHCTVSNIRQCTVGDKLKAECKEPRVVGPPDTSMHIRGEGPTIQLCGDRNVAEKWVNCHFAMEQKY